MIELEKIRAFIIKICGNLANPLIIEISLVLGNVYVFSRDQNKFEFYINNYINEDELK